jgi:ParB-like chromosome segregation protein Spo0J
MAEPNLPIARSIYHVDIDAIDAQGGLRPLDTGWVEALAVLMKRDGQERPIEIYPKGQGYGVTAGRHRLAAARSLGWKTIDADIMDASALGRRGREVSENLFRLGLSPLDRAAFVAEQIAIERARAGVKDDVSAQSVAATARWSDRISAEADDASVIMTRAFGFTDEVAEKVGLSRKTIYRDLELHRGLKPDVVEAIRTLPVASNASQLRALAKMPEADQRLVAGLIAEGTAKGVSDAVATLKQKPQPDAGQKAWSAVASNWTRLAAPARKEMFRHLAEAGLPRGVVITIDGETFGGEA